MQMRKVNKVIIHCTLTPEGRDVDFETIKKWHTDKGWRDIGYHYVIGLNGEIWKGRDLELAGSHCRGHNADSIGIAYVGGCDKKMKPKDTLNEAQYMSLIRLISILWKYYKFTIHGHNEFSNKACPSFNVKERLQEKVILNIEYINY